MNSKKFVLQANKLYFISGTAEAETELIAFDTALQKCGIHNANILEVSSVIPGNAELVEDAAPAEIEEIIDPGDFYPVVVSKEVSPETGEKIFAAVAGCKFESGYGVNVEVHGSGKNREEVKRKCERMLQDMAERRDEEIVGDTIFEYTSSIVEETCCAVSAVVYARE